MNCESSRVGSKSPSSFNFFSISVSVKVSSSVVSVTSSPNPSSFNIDSTFSSTFGFTKVGSADKGMCSVSVSASTGFSSNTGEVGFSPKVVLNTGSFSSSFTALLSGFILAIKALILSVSMSKDIAI